MLFTLLILQMLSDYCWFLKTEMNTAHKETAIKYQVYRRVVWKVLNLAYNWPETWDKRLLGRDPDRSWCHIHTNVKLFFVTAHGSMNIGGSIWMCCCSVHGSMCCNQESFTLVLQWHQLLSRFLPNGYTRRQPSSIYEGGLKSSQPSVRLAWNSGQAVIG